MSAPYGPPQPPDQQPPYQEQPPPGYPGIPPAGAPGAPPTGFPGGPAAPRRRFNTGLIIGLAVLALVLVACGVTAVVLVVARLTDDPSTAALPGLVNHRDTQPEALASTHREGNIDYPMTPPAGGPHNPVWQTCSGMVYDAPIMKEKAVHSLEHGAVWITYRPGLDAASVGKLADRVRNRDYVMMSPFPDQVPPISLQAWGYQLAVDSADDKRIAVFIARYSRTAAIETGAPCSGGDTTVVG
jgi:hypothetical protein